MTAVAPEVPRHPQGHGGCLICTTSRVPQNAYRPHTMNRECWCAFQADGSRTLEDCWLAKMYPSL